MRFKRTTNSDHNRSVYDNLLGQQFSMKTPNQAWGSDITYIWTAEGWLYLAALKDLCSKQVVGYSLSERMTVNLVCNALSMAIRNHKPSHGLIVHSDRGSQYCSHEYRNMLEKYGFQGSMSKKETVMITHRLRAFGEYSKTSWFTIATTKQEMKPKRILQNT